MSGGWVRVAPLAELLPGRGAGVLVGHDCVAVFSLGDGTVAAVDGIDPHSGANVMARGLIGSVEIDGQEVRFVASPLDKRRYRLDTGAPADGDGPGLGVWPVRVEGGVVEIAPHLTLIEGSGQLVPAHP